MILSHARIPIPPLTQTASAACPLSSLGKREGRGKLPSPDYLEIQAGAAGEDGIEAI